MSRDMERGLLLIAPLICVLNLGAILQESGELKKIVITINEDTSDTVIFTMARPIPTPCCGDILWSRVALNPSQVTQRSNLSDTISFLYQESCCEDSPQIRVSHALHNYLQSKWSKEGSRNTHKNTITAKHAHKSRREHKNQNDESQLKNLRLGHNNIGNMQ
jgi:hypothetical protein